MEANRSVLSFHEKLAPLLKPSFPVLDAALLSELLPQTYCLPPLQNHSQEQLLDVVLRTIELL